ncbi:M28 family metallopeptidase [Haloferula chungangensis]|uniref:M28 family metallopeptidase n=1 Tax=Haloferula chungangensis TaxID=1048331 RepID=A0ABW2L3R9_9BACT
MKSRLVPLALSFTALGLILTFGQCRKAESTPPQRVTYQPIAGEIADAFSGANAFAHVEKIVSFGPRPPSSEGYQKTLQYLESTLKEFGWITSRQTFRAATPDGPLDFTNLLARHPSAPAHPTSLPVIIGGHLDSKKLSFPFVGANDGGSSTGVMLELARVLSTKPSAAAQIEFAFFDGEEAFRPNITPSDGLYGSKYFAHDLSTRPSWPSIGIVLDIVGDPNFPLYYNPETPEHFAAAVEKAAPPLAFKHPLVKAPGPIIDDHVPLQNTGLPCLHVIGDFQQMNYWHQPGDTLDKLTPEMLEKVGKLTLGFLSELQTPSSK